MRQLQDQKEPINIPFGSIFKWILIILLFPFSVIFLAYYKQRKVKREYYKSED